MKPTEIEFNVPSNLWVTLHYADGSKRRIAKATYERAKRIYESICEFYVENKVVPTIREIMEITDIKTTSHVNTYLEIIEGLGLIVRSGGTARSYVVVGAKVVIDRDTELIPAEEEKSECEENAEELERVRQLLMSSVPRQSRYMTAIGIALRHQDTERMTRLTLDAVKEHCMER